MHHSTVAVLHVQLLNAILKFSCSTDHPLKLNPYTNLGVSTQVYQTGLLSTGNDVMYAGVSWQLRIGGFAIS